MSSAVVAAISPGLDALGMTRRRFVLDAPAALRQSPADHQRIVETPVDRDPDAGPRALIGRIHYARGSTLAAVGELRGAGA